MSILKSITKLRRSLMRRITRRMGVTRITGNSTDVSIRKILIVRLNHRLGNLLLITPLLQDIENTFPEAEIDLFVKGSAASELFKNYGNIKRIIALPKKPHSDLIKYITGWAALRKNDYDLVINAIHSSSSGKITTQLASGKVKFLGEVNEDIRARNPDYKHMAKIPVYSFRHFTQALGFRTEDAAVPPLNLKLTDTEVVKGKRLLLELVKNNKRTIGIYTYATGSKCYPPEWWSEFVELLKGRFPQHNILEVLPIENVSQIEFKMPSFYSKNLREIASLISNLSIFIAADSGMMHLASAAGATVVGLFKSDNIDQYAPFNDGSVGIHTGRVSQREVARTIAHLMIPENRELPSRRS